MLARTASALLAPLAAIALALALALAAAPGCSSDECRNEPSPPAGSQVDWASIDCAGKPACEPALFCMRIDEGLSAEQRAIVRESLYDWQASTHAAVTFVDAPPCLELSIDARPDGDPVFDGEGEPRPRGITRGEAIHLNRDRLCGTHVTRHVVRHELGHLLGLQHSLATGSLMRPIYSPDRSVLSVGTADVTAYLQARNCCPR